MTSAGGLIAYVEYQIRRRETLDPILDASSGSHIELDGLQIHYESRGEGKPTVLIHGFGGSTYSWRHNLDALAAGRDYVGGSKSARLSDLSKATKPNVGDRAEASRKGRSDLESSTYAAYALDLPGFGYSSRTTRPVFGRTFQAALVHRFLEAARGRAPEAEGVVVVGHSLGAAVALRFALDYPKATRGLVLVAPSAGSSGRRPRHTLRLVFDVPLLGPILARTIFFLALGREAALARILASAYGSRMDIVTEEVREALLRPLRVRGSANSALGLARSRDSHPFRERFREIATPILVIAGARDRAVPLDEVKALHALLPTSRLVVFDDAGHLPQEEDPDLFNVTVLDWLSGLERC